MRRRRKPKSCPRPPVAIEHTGFYPYLVRYNEAMRVRGYAETTLHKRESLLRRFIAWCDARGLDRPQDITKPILERYQRHLYYYRQADGRPLSATSQNRYLTSVRQFFKWLTQQNHLLYNPASELVILREPPTLPVVLSEGEVESLLNQPDITQPAGLRDRAMLEVLYATGLRRSELCRLQLRDLSPARGTLYVRQGKGGKDRIVPLGERAYRWVVRYLETVRPRLLLDMAEQSLFVNDYGEPMRGNKLSDRVKRYLKKAGIDVPGSCHLLRHAMATHMLENGAEMRFIQALLGHSDYQSTQIYTHVSIRKLREIHAATHPAGKHRPSTRAEGDDGGMSLWEDA